MIYGNTKLEFGHLYVINFLPTLNRHMLLIEFFHQVPILEEEHIVAVGRIQMDIFGCTVEHQGTKPTELKLGRLMEPIGLIGVEKKPLMISHIIVHQENSHLIIILEEEV